MKRRMRIESARILTFRETEPGFVLPGEAPECYKLTWLEKGLLHSVADGRDTLLQPGELLLYRPGQWHMQYADMEHAPRFVSILLHPEAVDLAPLTDRKLTPSPDISPLLPQILRELELDDPYSHDLILSALETVLLHLLRAHSASAVEIPAPLHAENRIIRRAQQYVSAHVRDKLTVPTVARNAGVSPSYLTALFQKHLDFSPGEYIRRVKLQESKQLIREGKMSVTEIAATLNYSTVHHFSRQFKDKFGISPTEYAKSLR